MSLTKEQKREIKEFFNNSKYEKVFIELFELLWTIQNFALLSKNLQKGSGFSLEEFYDQFEAMIKDQPEILEDIISRSFYNQRKNNSEENDNG